MRKKGLFETLKQYVHNFADVSNSFCVQVTTAAVFGLALKKGTYENMNKKSSKHSTILHVCITLCTHSLLYVSGDGDSIVIHFSFFEGEGGGYDMKVRS